MSNKKLDMKSLNPTKLRRYLLLISAIVVFIVIIGSLSIGGSRSEPFDKAKDEVYLEDSPTIFNQIPNQNSINSTGGFNISDSFNSPGFDVPPNLAAELPSGIGGGDFGTIPDINNGGSTGNNNGGNNNGGNVELPNPPGGGNFEIPDLNPPDIPTGQEPINNGNVNNNPSNGGVTNQPEFNPNINNEKPKSNNTIIKVKFDKARNLPKLDFLHLPKIDLSFIRIPKLEINLSVSSGIFIFFITSIFYLNNLIVPSIINKLENVETMFIEEDTIFYQAKSIKLDKKKLEQFRIRRFLSFKDQIDDLIKRSYKRLESESPNSTIINGYYDLDKAFDDFTRFVREKNITPLEHARRHFETNELDNSKLEKLVDLFYLSRFANQTMSKEQGKQFIKLLEELIMADYSNSIINQ